jgi:Holliday junction resolvase RusA-like endonuclease
MRYVIEGKPVPLQRVRFVSNHCWDAQKALKRKVAINLERQHDSLPLLSGPLKLIITFYFESARSLSVTKRHALIDKSHIARPDLSNLIKFIEDIAIGILYDDDSIIAEIEARKCYDAIPRTEFELIPLER